MRIPITPNTQLCKLTFQGVRLPITTNTQQCKHAILGVLSPFTTHTQPCKLTCLGAQIPITTNTQPCKLTFLGVLSPFTTNTQQCKHAILGVRNPSPQTFNHVYSRFWVCKAPSPGPLTSEICVSRCANPHPTTIQLWQDTCLGVQPMRTRSRSPATAAWDAGRTRNHVHVDQQQRCVVPKGPIAKDNLTSPTLDQSLPWRRTEISKRHLIVPALQSRPRACQHTVISKHASAMWNKWGLVLNEPNLLHGGK